MTDNTITRAPAVAGIFYSSDKATLTREVDGYLAQAATPHAGKTPAAGKLVAVIAPHAGYEYSGMTAAYAYAQFRGISCDTVVVVAPSHREYFDGISIFSGSGYGTPLGTVLVDEHLRDKLAGDSEIIEVSESGHKSEEHSLEVQLPFIQRTLAQTKLLPIVMGDQRREYCVHLGEKLALSLAGSNSLLVASSDLSHYHSYQTANTLDAVIAGRVRSFDEASLMADLESNRVEACGGGPIVSVMIAARLLGATHARLLHQCNSGDVSGDRGRVVGYLAAAFTTGS